MVTNVPKSSEVVQSTLIILSVVSFHSHVKNLDGFIECKNIKAKLKVWRGQTCKRKKSTEKVINVDFFHGLVFFIQRCQYISGHDLPTYCSGLDKCRFPAESKEQNQSIALAVSQNEWIKIGGKKGDKQTKTKQCYSAHW